MTASAPAATAALDLASVFSVALVPVPAITGTRPLARATTAAMTSRCSSSESVGDSPVVPHGTSPSTQPART
jgi:hypothetical protein